MREFAPGLRPNPVRSAAQHPVFVDERRVIAVAAERPQRYSAAAVSRPYLPQISPILRHFSPVLSVLAPGSRRPQNNGEKTAQNGRKVAEKIGGQVALGYHWIPQKIDMVGWKLSFPLTAETIDAVGSSDPTSS